MSFLEADNQIKAIATQQAIVANHQVMMQAPSKMRDKYFEEVYAFIILQASEPLLVGGSLKSRTTLKKARSRTEIKSI